MAIDDRLYDRLYDPQEAPDRRFLLYSPKNSYIVPYSSDTHGAELVTEFNQRAALNTLLERVVDMKDYADIVAAAINEACGAETPDPITSEIVKEGPGLNSFKNSVIHDRDNWHVRAYATGCRNPEDFKLELVGDHLVISAGTALVYGYYVESNAEVRIQRSDVLTQQDVMQVMDNPGQNPDNPCCTKFVKLAVQYTVAPENQHDQRLIPPINGVYQGAAIVINDELPYGNELLLGTVTRDSNGAFYIVDNPHRTRLVSIDGVDGAANYESLLSAIDDSHIYGIKYGSTEGSDDGSVTNLVDIDKWLWIAFESNLGTLLRSMSTNAETAGDANDEPTRGIIVSDQTPYTANDPVVDNFNCLQRVDANIGNSFARMSWHQAQVPGKTGSDIIDHRALYFPYALSNMSGSSLNAAKLKPTPDKSVIKPFYDLVSYPCLNGLNGTDGLMTYQQLAMLEMMFDDYVHRMPDGYARGKQYGPFLTLQDAADWFETHKPVINVGDYFWVINDTAEAGGVEATYSASGYNLTHIVTNYGTVSGTVTGTAKQAKLTVPVSGTVTGSVTVSEEDIPISGEVTGVGTGTINATVSGTVTGNLNSFNQNVSARYVCRFTDTWLKNMRYWWHFTHAVMIDEDVTHITLASTTITDGNVRPGSLIITPSLDNPVVTNQDTLAPTGPGTIIRTALFDNKHGKIVIKPDGKEVEIGTIDYLTGVITGVDANADAAVAFIRTGADVSYEILDPPDEVVRFYAPETSQSVLFTVEAVERGFAVPATESTFGVVKTGTGSELTDVVNDPITQRLRISDTLLNFIKNGGFKASADTVIPISPNQDLTRYQYSIYQNGVTFQMLGNASAWRAALSTTGTLAHLRGNITLDFSGIIEDGHRSDGLLLYLEDVDYVTLKGNNLKTIDHVPTDTCLFGMNHCKVNSPFFTNIGEWKYSSFISGGDTLELDLPWMMIPQIFTKAINSTDEDKGNSLSCRFSSITMGEHGVCSAMLDVWVKYQGWEDYNGNIDRMWSSLGYVNFPPLFFEYNLDEEAEEITVNEGETAPTVVTRGPINQNTIIRIPENLNLKISGASGVHQGWDANNSEFVPSGNFLVNMNWEWNGNPSSAKTRAGKVYLNLYMKNSSADVKKQNFSNLRFRAPVQVIRLDNNSMSETVTYSQLYGDVDTSLN